MMKSDTFQVKGLTRVYQAYKLTRQVRDDGLNGSSVRDELPIYKLADGRALNMQDDDTFEIVNTGEILTRVK